MRTDRSFANVAWVDLESPTPEELADAVHEFDLDPFVAEELAAPSHYPFAIPGKNACYLILHFPVEKQSHTDSEGQEVDFVIGKDFVLTARYGAVDAFHKLHKELEVAEHLSRIPERATPTDLFVRIVRAMYLGIEHELFYQRDRMREIERSIFADDELSQVKPISDVSRALTVFSLGLAPHSEVLESLARDKRYEVAGRMLIGEVHRLQALVVAYREAIADIRASNDSLVQTRQNIATGRLTFVATLFLPITLFISLFGMNTMGGMPFLKDPAGFWVVIGLGVVFAIVFWILVVRPAHRRF